MSNSVRKTTGVLALSYANREKPAGLSDRQMEELQPVIRNRGDPLNFQNCTMAFYNGPTEGTADEASYLADQIDAGMHLALVFSHTNTNEIETFKKSGLCQELLRRYNSGEISYIEITKGIVLPVPSERYRTFRKIFGRRNEPGISFTVQDFYIESGDFECEFLNTGRLYSLKGCLPVEKEIPPLIVHFPFASADDVSFYRSVLPQHPRWINTKSIKWRDSSEEVHSFPYKTFTDEDKKNGYLDDESEHRILLELSCFNLNAVVSKKVGAYGSRVHFVGFPLDFSKQANYDMLLRMLQESANTRPASSRKLVSEKKPITSDISTIVEKE